MKTDALAILGKSLGGTVLATAFLDAAALGAAEAAVPSALADFADADLEDPGHPRAELAAAMASMLSGRGIPSMLLPVAVKRWMQAADATAAAELRWRTEVKGERLSIPRAGNRRIKIMDELASDLADRSAFDEYVLSRLGDCGGAGGCGGVLPEAAAAAFAAAGLPLDPDPDQAAFLSAMDVQWVAGQSNLVGRLGACCGRGAGGVRDAWNAVPDAKTLLWAAFAFGADRGLVLQAREAELACAGGDRCAAVRRILTDTMFEGLAAPACAELRQAPCGRGH